ncbi:Fc.00g058680.m01.CDS01 [Cosmosporella sp. VM-42]
MDSPLELFVLPWGVYPRRILLYLAEKGLDSSPLIKITPVTITREGISTPDGKPPGTVPILKLPDGSFIKQSVAIIDYFEDICDRPDPKQAWQVKLANSAGTKTMRGDTAEERAWIRDMVCLADEANSQFGFACHKGSVLFVPMETTNALTAKLALEYCKKNLKLLDKYYVGDELLKGGREVNIADCVLYSLLYFAKDLYSLDLLDDPELSDLQRFYETFGKRESARVEKDHFPEDVKTLACQWLPVE